MLPDRGIETVLYLNWFYRYSGRIAGTGSVCGHQDQVCVGDEGDGELTLTLARMTVT